MKHVATFLLGVFVSMIFMFEIIENEMSIWIYAPVVLFLCVFIGWVWWDKEDE